MKNALLVLAVTATLAACGKDQPVSFYTLETSRSTAKANAEYNAQKYRAESPQFANFALEVQGDSTQSPTCPQGDGWAEVVFMRSEREEGKTKNLEIQKATVMCSTVSSTQGCVMVAPTDNWAKHPGKMQDGQCASTREVPFPLPKAVGSK